MSSKTPRPKAASKTSAKSEAKSGAKSGARSSAKTTPKAPRRSGKLGGSPLGGSPLGGGLGTGRGLGALIPGGVNERKARLIEVHIDHVQPDPKQPRRRFGRAALEELADSIRAQGVLQPLIVTPLEQGRYRIIAGERRWRAAKLAELRSVPVVCREASEQEAFELAVLENVQRVDLTPLEEALSYHRLIEEFELSHERVAERTGKSRSTITNALRLLKLPAEVITMLDEGSLSAGHGRALLALEEPSQLIKLAEVARDEALSVREVERRARALNTPPPAPAPPGDSPSTPKWVSSFGSQATRALTQHLSGARGGDLSVNVKAHPQGGAQLKITVKDEETAQALLALLKGE